MPLTLRRMKWQLSVCRLETGKAQWLPQGEFFSITRTPTEYSIVCESCYATTVDKAEHGWIAYGVDGQLDFSLVGILSGITAALAAQSISVFAISTFDTDYILVKQHNASNAEHALRAAGYHLA